MLDNNKFFLLNMKIIFEFLLWFFVSTFVFTIIINFSPNKLITAIIVGLVIAFLATKDKTDETK